MYSSEPVNLNNSIEAHNLSSESISSPYSPPSTPAGFLNPPCGIISGLDCKKRHASTAHFNNRTDNGLLYFSSNRAPSAATAATSAVEVLLIPKMYCSSVSLSGKCSPVQFLIDIPHHHPFAF